MQFIRIADGRPVAREEACSLSGVVKSGYSVRVGFMDATRPGQGVTDAAVSLSDAETVLAVARARRTHEAAHAYRGRGAPGFTDAQAQAAVANAVARKQAGTVTASAAGIRDAVTIAERHVLATANRDRKTALANRWRR